MSRYYIPLLLNNKKLKKNQRNTIAKFFDF